MGQFVVNIMGQFKHVNRLTDYLHLLISVLREITGKRDSCGAGGSSSAEVVRKGLSEEGTFELGEEVRHLKIWSRHLQLEVTRSAQFLK